jgi:hypothetical protein
MTKTKQTKKAEPVTKEQPVTAPPANSKDEKAEERAIKLFTTTAADTETATVEPSVSETPPQTTNQEDQIGEGVYDYFQMDLKELTKMVEEFEEFDWLIMDPPYDRDGGTLTKKEQIQQRERFHLLESKLFDGDDWGVPGYFEPEFVQLRTRVMELGDSDEVKELLRRIDELAESLGDE